MLSIPQVGQGVAVLITVAWKGSPLIFQFLDFLALGKSFRHIQVPLKVIDSYKVNKALKCISEVGGLNPWPL